MANIFRLVAVYVECSVYAVSFSFGPPVSQNNTGSTSCFLLTMADSFETHESYLIDITRNFFFIRKDVDVDQEHMGHFGK